MKTNSIHTVDRNRRNYFLSDVKNCPVIVAVFILALMTPSEISFAIGGLRLTPYRLILICTFFPSLMKVIRKNTAGFLLADFLVIFNLLWAAIVISYHHGASMAIESGGVRVIELGGAYFLARGHIVDERSYRGAVAFLIFTVCLLFPITLFETVTGRHPIKELSALISGSHFYDAIRPRFGFYRAYGPFDHPILFGGFSASLFAMGWFSYRKPYSKVRLIHYVRQGIITITALCSISSVAIAALSTQFIIIGWGIVANRINKKWLLLSSIIIIMYLSVELLSSRSAIKVFLSYLTFSSNTAYNRIAIFNYGIQDVLNNPIFGIGFNVWSRPSWMHSTSMDNFWLVQAVTFGLPGFFSLFLASLLLISKKWKFLSVELINLRAGWTISMIGVVFTACTTHFWNNSFVYYGFLMGAGVWFLGRAACTRTK